MPLPWVECGSQAIGIQSETDLGRIVRMASEICSSQLKEKRNVSILETDGEEG